MKMLNYILIVLILAKGICGEAQSLQDILETVRKNSLAAKKESAQQQARQAEVKGVDAAYDWYLSMDARNVHDRSEQNNLFAGEQRLFKDFNIDIKKQFFTGTQVSAGYKYGWNNTLFPPPTPPTTLPDGTVVMGMDPSMAMIYNPAYTNTFSLSIMQPLFKNFLSKEIESKRAILQKVADIPRYTLMIRLQADQYMAEKLYWSIIGLRYRIEIAQKLLRKSRDFTKHMATRVQIGRGENVDLADAEARVIQYETNVLEMEIARDELMMQLATLMRSSRKESIHLTLNDKALFRSEMPLPVQEPKAAIIHAEKSRLDLILNNTQQKVTQAQINAAREEGKWDISLYAHSEINAIEENQNDSLNESLEGKFVRNVIGLKVDIPLGGNTGINSKILSHSHEKSALEVDRHVTLRSIQEQLEVAFLKLNGAKRREELLKRQIESLKKKQQQENQKLQQARSEQVAVIRYEMEVMAAELELARAYLDQRSTEASIRYYLHAYPTRIN